MVGLSVILEPNQVLSKASVVNRTGHHYSLVQTPPFPNLHCCYLCKQILLPGKDIYMYNVWSRNGRNYLGYSRAKGDKGFCSVECRCRQILMDEQESMMNEKHSSIKTSPFSSPESGSSSSRNCKKSTRNGRGEFAY